MLEPIENDAKMLKRLSGSWYFCAHLLTIQRLIKWSATRIKLTNHSCSSNSTYTKTLKNRFFGLELAFVHVKGMRKS
jgi:hypothetical protein